jgi:hypothetical protein
MKPEQLANSTQSNIQNENHKPTNPDITQNPTNQDTVFFSSINQ